MAALGVAGCNGFLTAVDVKTAVFPREEFCDFLCADAVFVLHVSPPFADIEGAVSVKGDVDGFFNHGFTGDALERVTFGHLNRFDRFLWSQRGKGWIPALFRSGMGRGGKVQGTKKEQKGKLFDEWEGSLSLTLEPGFCADNICGLSVMQTQDLGWE